MDTADRIFYALDKIGMEQKAFAAAIGTFPSTVSGWKTGKTKSYKNYLPKIAEVLHISVDYLLTGAEKEPTTVSSDGSTVELMKLYYNLQPEQQELILAAMRGLQPEK